MSPLKKLVKPDNYVEILQFLPQRLQELQATLAHRIFRWALRLKYGRNSIKYLKSSFNWWTLQKECDGRWESLSPAAKQASIEASVDYCLYFTGKHRKFRIIARLLPSRSNYFLFELEQLVSTLINDRPINRTPKMRFAFILLGDAESNFAVIEQLVEWLDLVVVNLEFVVFFAHKVPDYVNGSRPNIQYKVLPDLLSFSEIKEPTLLSPSGNNMMEGSFSLEGLFRGVPFDEFDAILISPEGTQLDRSVWQARLTRLGYMLPTLQSDVPPGRAGA